MLEGLKRLIFNTDIDDVSEEGELEEINRLNEALLEDLKLENNPI